MSGDPDPLHQSEQSASWAIAVRWCQDRGDGWSVVRQLGVGGTAPVFEVTAPDGLRALKIYDSDFSSGSLGAIENKRIQQQLSLRGHECPSLVQVYDGGTFEDRLYLLMSRAPGNELEKCLTSIPRDKIRGILHHVARASLFLRDRDICHRDIKAANVFVSDDFGHATLLDISVIRDIHHPVGVGTDSNGQLPVLATTRYCPPEYLFRLLEPGAGLWHALTVYQLGALLHDLIMKAPLFHDEYEQSASNRYRFAWLVATRVPHIHASDVDEDLVFLAHRALDKDWKRRSTLRIEDFLQDASTVKRNAFQVLGMLPNPAVPDHHPALQERRMRLDTLSSTLKTHLTSYFQENGVRTTHRVVPGPHGDDSRRIRLQWDAAGTLGASATLQLDVTLCLLLDDSSRRFSVVVALARLEDGDPEEVHVQLPDVPDDDRTEATLATQTEAALGHLATTLVAAAPAAD